MIKEYKPQHFRDSAFTTNINDASFAMHQFTDFSSKDIEITKCSFCFSTFTRCYFRKVKFTECDFTGCKFFDSNFRDAEFINCKFEYAIFKFTLLRSTEMLSNLPSWPNVRALLLQNLKANANSFGDFAAVKQFLLEEIKANREHLRQARNRSDRYYKNKYKSLKTRFNIWEKSIRLYFDRILWGHGEQPFRIPINIFFVIVLVALFQISKNAVTQDLTVVKLVEAFWNYFKSNIKAFIGVPGPNLATQGEAAILICFRYVSLALFVRILFNRYSWR